MDIFHNEELIYLHSSPNIFRVIKSGILQARNVSCIWETEEVHTGFWWGDLRERDNLEEHVQMEG